MIEVCTKGSRPTRRLLVSICALTITLVDPIWAQDIDQKDQSVIKDLSTRIGLVKDEVDTIRIALERTVWYKSTPTII
jgi:hypothetical protein